MPTPLVPPPRRTTFIRTTPPPTYREKTARRRRAQVTALAAAALVVGLTAVPAWNALHEPGDGGQPAVTGSATPGPPPPTSATTPATDLTWVNHDGAYLPVSVSAGPTRQDGPLNVGYARSDLGAVIAAVHIASAAGPSAGPASFRAALSAQVTGPQRQVLLVAVERDYAEARATAGLADGARLPAGDATLLGYTVGELPAGNRQVSLVLTQPDADGATSAYAVAVVMTWADGDWRLVAPSAGTWNSAVSLLGAAPSAVPTDVVRFDPPQPSPAQLAGEG